MRLPFSHRSMGAEVQIEIRQQRFDPWQELARYQNESGLLPGSYGACAAFVGTMRDFNQGENVREMVLEHYSGMTEKLLIDHAEALALRHDLLELLILHRVGRILPNDSIVLVAAWSAHRGAALDACREMMEYLKSQATFWKKETLIDSAESARQRWVDNVSG